MRDHSLDNDAGIFLFEALGGVSTGTITRQTFKNLSNSVRRAFSTLSITEIGPLYSEHLTREISSYIDSHVGERVTAVDFIGCTIYRAVSLAFFGPGYPLDTQQDIQHTIMNFSALLSPRFFLPSHVKGARDRTIAALGEFLREWREPAGTAGACNPAVDLLRNLQKLGFSTQHERSVLFAFVVGLHINTLRVTCWLLAYLLHDPEAFTTIRSEIDHFVDDKYHGSIEALSVAPMQVLGPQNLPFLHSAQREVLRICFLPFVIRQAPEDMDYVLDETHVIHMKKGEYLAADGHVLNLDSTAFPDPSKFKFDRFTAFGDINDKAAPPCVSAFGSGAHVVR